VVVHGGRCCVDNRDYGVDCALLPFADFDLLLQRVPRNERPHTAHCTGTNPILYVLPFEYV
jgi:hypothetical protein